MAIYLKITNPTEVVKKKTSKWLTDITPERIDRKLVEDEVIKGIIEQLTLEGIKGEISAINGFEVNESSVITKNNFVIRKTKTFQIKIKIFNGNFYFNYFYNFFNLYNFKELSN